MTSGVKRKKRKGKPPAKRGQSQPKSRNLGTPRTRRRKTSTSSVRARILKLSLGTGFLLFVAFISLFCWGFFPANSNVGSQDSPMWLEVTSAEPLALAEQMYEAQLVDSIPLMQVYLALMVPRASVSLRRHAFQPGLTPREIGARLTGARGREVSVVTIREGLNSFEIGSLLEREGVCDRTEFLSEVFNTLALAQWGLVAPSAEGWLFPATYEFRADSSASEIVRLLVKEGQKRFRASFAAAETQLSPQVEEFTRLFGVQGVVTLASIIEKEAASQRSRIAQVFYNRLDDLKKETSGRLQSDPTALYGCFLRPQLPSCAGKLLKVTPKMLRDPANPYNTYRHSGLPPGPISNPGEAAFSAALRPSHGDALYFFADGKGQHLFSSTYAEHRKKVAKKRTPSLGTRKTRH